jgi:hypothetical protein
VLGGVKSLKSLNLTNVYPNNNNNNNNNKNNNNKVKSKPLELRSRVKINGLYTWVCRKCSQYEQEIVKLCDKIKRYNQICTKN